MTAFSAIDAALEGFRLTRERPKVVLIWAVFSFLVSIVSAVYLVSIGQDARAVIEASATEQAPDLATSGRALAAMLPMGLLGMAIQCVMACAVYRILLRPEDKGFAYLKLGADEARLAALTLIYVLMASMTLAVVVTVAAIVAGLVSSGGPLAMIGVQMFFFGLLAYLAVRLSLAPAITFAERRIAVFDSWKLTEGLFLRLISAYALAVFAIVIIALLVLTIFTAVVAIAIGGDLQAAGRMFSPDASSFSTYFSVIMVLYLLVSAWLSALYYAVMVAPAAFVYRELRAPRAASPA